MRFEASWGAKRPNCAVFWDPFGAQNGLKTAQGEFQNYKKNTVFYSISELGRVQGAAWEVSKNESKNRGGRMSSDGPVLDSSGPVQRFRGGRWRVWEVPSQELGSWVDLILSENAWHPRRMRRIVEVARDRRILF